MKNSFNNKNLPRLLWIYHATPGINLSVTTQLEATRALRKLGWDVTLVLEGPDGEQMVEGMPVYCLQQPRIYLLGYALFHLKLLRFILRHWSDYDILYAHQMSYLWLQPLRLLRALQRRSRPLIVMDTRDLVSVSRRLKARLQNQYYNLAHWVANHFSDGQTAITEPMAELVKIPQSMLWGIWPSGVDVTQFAPAYADRRWPDEDQPVDLMYIGVLLRERNLLPLCHAVMQAQAEGMNLRLTLIGNGPILEELKDIAAQSNGCVRVLPPVPHDKVPEVLSQTHVGVTALPYVDDVKYQVSSPIKLFEYMAAGLPILSTRNICHTNVVKNGTFAFWADAPTVEGLMPPLRKIWSNRVFLAQKSDEAVKASYLWTWSEAAVKIKTALEKGLTVKTTEKVMVTSRR